MLKLRLKRTGRKRSPFYRLVIMEHSTRRDGRPVDEVGYYDPITKKLVINREKISYWLHVGVKSTRTVDTLLEKNAAEQEKEILGLLKNLKDSI